MCVCPQVSESMPARLFSFMNPLAVEIWFSMLGAYLLVSLTIWVVARFSPVEWRVPEPCCLGLHEPEQEPEVFENDFTLANSFWFTIGTLMQQGSDLNPQVKHAENNMFLIQLTEKYAEFFLYMIETCYFYYIICFII